MIELVVVKVVGSEPEAELLCSLLRSADIECALRQTNVGAGAADGMPGGPYELVVRPQDLDDARDILRPGSGARALAQQPRPTIRRNK